MHLLAAGVWVGSALVMVVALLPLLRSHRQHWREVALNGLRRFGPVAFVSVGILATTGLYNASRQVASVDAWIATLYGQVLAGKTLLFLGIGLAGLINSALLHPRVAAAVAATLRRPSGWVPFNIQRLPILLVAEAAFGLTALAATGWLTATPPARGPEFAPPRLAAKAPASMTVPVDDLIVNLQIRPNQPGPNLVSIGAFNTRRPAPAEIIRVMLRLTYNDKDLGTQTLIAEPEGEGRYRLNTSMLSLAGAWHAQVVVRRSGMEDSLAEFDWRVEPFSPSAPPRPVILSNQPLEPVLMWLALGMLGITLAATLTLVRLRKGAPASPNAP
jgi:copper transport protein